MENQQFQIGDIVQLKSGGPRMTVKDTSKFTTDADVYCQWFAGSKLESGHFHPSTIVRVDEPEAQSKKR